MKHLTITELPSGFKRLTPDTDYLLFNKITKQFYSTAEVKDIKPYIAVKA